VVKQAELETSERTAWLIDRLARRFEDPLLAVIEPLTAAA